MGKDHRLKKLARTLLATSCLTAAAGAANAATFVESSFAGGDFSNNLSSPSILNATYDTVVGSIDVTSISDGSDYFQIPGLVAGGSYFLTYSAVGGLPPASLRLYDGVSQIAGPLTNGASINVTVPLDQDLRFGIVVGEGPSNYTVSFTENAPEPGTFGAAGMALAGTLALRNRKRRK
jgi:hypothetical protein